VLIIRVFPPGRLRIEALARAGAIALFWDTCRAALARRGVAAFIDFMNRNSDRLMGTPNQKTELINLMLTGVGLPSFPPNPIVLGDDFGIGTVDPNATTTTRIETEGNTALIEFEPAENGQPAAFNELTVVSIFRHGDDFRLVGFPPEDQYPPFFDYTASNASNNHVIAAGAVVRMAFCLLLDTFENDYPDAVRIGHNPAANVPGPRFEIIPEDEDVGDFAGDLICSNLETSLGGFGGGLREFGRATGRMFAPLARTLFLPRPLMAVAVGNRGPLGGLPPSLSDFGVVNATSYFGYEDGEPSWDDNESFWNRRSVTPLSNSAFPTFVSTFNSVGVAGGTVPPPFRGNRSGWYGQFSTGNYIGTQLTGDLAGSGGTSTAFNSGAFVSPELEVPNVSADVELRFKTWWEIEGVQPSTFDIMTVEIEHGVGEVDTVAVLNPESDPDPPPISTDRAAMPYTSKGFNTAPDWEDEAIDISAYKGQMVSIRFSFNTVDHQYNGFRGWLVEDVRVSTGTSQEVEPELMVRKLKRLRALAVPGGARRPRP
jgi:hypothetical protein